MIHGFLKWEQAGHKFLMGLQDDADLLARVRSLSQEDRARRLVHFCLLELEIDLGAIAAVCKISDTTANGIFLEGWELGEAHLEKLSAVFGIPLSFFLAGEITPPEVEWEEVIAECEQRGWSPKEVLLWLKRKAWGLEP